MGPIFPLEPDLDAHHPLLDDPLPDVRAFDTHVNAGPPQDVGTADARALEQQRRLDRASAEDHLLARAIVHGLPSVRGPHPRHVGTVEQQAAGSGPGGHGQIAAPADRPDKGAVGADTPSVPDGGGREPDALAVVSVDVDDVFPAHALGRGQNSLGGLVAAFGDRHRDWASGAAHVRGAETMVFHHPVGRQHAVPVPAGVAASGQGAPVARRAAGPHHAVDRGRSAQDPAAGPGLDLAARTNRLRRIVVGVALSPEDEIRTPGGRRAGGSYHGPRTRAAAPG